MLKTFALLAVFNGQIYIVDDGLSQDDCRLAVSAGVSEVWLDSETFITGNQAQGFYCRVEESD